MAIDLQRQQRSQTDDEEEVLLHKCHTGATDARGTGNFARRDPEKKDDTRGVYTFLWQVLNDDDDEQAAIFTTLLF